MLQALSKEASMGNPFVHIELNTGDPARAQKFYGQVFQWKLQPMPQMGYTMIDVGKGVGGGMQKKPMAEAPTQWLPYVEVKDVADTLAKARAAGAQVVVEEMPVGEMGKIGIFIDPTGAGIGVWATAKKPARRKAPPKKRAAAKKKKR
jgi:predicted enzyme related to lactoylglutathione lyase